MEAEVMEEEDSIQDHPEEVEDQGFQLFQVEEEQLWSAIIILETMLVKLTTEFHMFQVIARIGDLSTF